MLYRSAAACGYGRFLARSFAVPIVACLAGAPLPAQTPSSHPCSDIEALTVPDTVLGGLAPGPHTVVMDGVRFWYCVGGTATGSQAPVVFIHGGPGEGSQHFAALTGPSLESALQLVYFDQRGSGRSERPWTGDYALSTLVEDIDRLRERLGVDQISLIAHSFGGLLALEYAAAHPERVERMVLISALSDVAATTRSACTRLAALDTAAYARATAHPLPGGLCNPFAAYSGAAREAYDRAAMFPDSAVAEAVTAADRRGGLRNTGEMSRALFSRPDLFSIRFTGYDRIRAPVLVVAGREDYQIGLEPQEALADSLPNGRLLIIEHGGHFPHLDAPERFASAVIAFLRKSK
jgi:proline iminopeptidase